MERLQQKIEQTTRVLSALDKVLAIKADEVVRDATIQHFEFCVEAAWKMLQLHLRNNEGIDSGSPKQVFRSCLKVGLMNEQQTNLALQMIDDRNLTVHTYNEELAETIYSNIAKYTKLMHSLVSSIQ